MISIAYHRDAEPPVVVVSSEAGQDFTWPLAQFEEDTSGCLAASGVDNTPPVRQRVTKAALKMAAGQAGLLGQVNDFIAQLPYDAPAVILWNDAGDFKRSDALWNFMAAQFGVTTGDVDALFNMAGQIDDSFGGGLL